MSTLILADLHLDFWHQAMRDPLLGLSKDQLEAVTLCVVAGDLSNNGAKLWPGHISWLSQRMPNASVFVMPGNHDYYGGRIDREDKLADAAQRSGGRFLQKGVVMSEGRRFLCCTLWTDFMLDGEAGRWVAMHNAERVMNDYQKIRVEAKGYSRLRPSDTAAIHFDHRRWLADELAKPFEGETVVVTHHAPHPRSLGRGDPGVDAAYVSDLTNLIAKHQPALWVHGHTHEPCDYLLGDTRVMNAGIGYPHQCPEGQGGRACVLLYDRGGVCDALDLARRAAPSPDSSSDPAP